MCSCFITFLYFIIFVGFICVLWWLVLNARYVRLRLTNVGASVVHSVAIS